MGKHIDIDYIPLIVFANDDIDIVNDGTNNVIRRSELINFIEQYTSASILGNDEIALITDILQSFSVEKDTKRDYRDYSCIVEKINSQKDYITEAISTYNKMISRYSDLKNEKCFYHIVKIGFTPSYYTDEEVPEDVDCPGELNFYYPEIEEAFFIIQKMMDHIINMIFNCVGRKDGEAYICSYEDYCRITNWPIFFDMGWEGMFAKNPDAKDFIEELLKRSLNESQGFLLNHLRWHSILPVHHFQRSGTLSLNRETSNYFINRCAADNIETVRWEGKPFNRQEYEINEGINHYRFLYADIWERVYKLAIHMHDSDAEPKE
ncbi:MAG: hypothetical protein Q4A65_08465 [Bacillota bacterium]|nr:hypothetical protein [Bacillota bacterium]